MDDATADEVELTFSVEDGQFVIQYGYEWIVLTNTEAVKLFDALGGHLTGDLNG